MVEQAGRGAMGRLVPIIEIPKVVTLVEVFVYHAVRTESLLTIRLAFPTSQPPNTHLPHLAISVMLAE